MSGPLYPSLGDPTQPENLLLFEFLFLDWGFEGDVCVCWLLFVRREGAEIGEAWCGARWCQGGEMEMDGVIHIGTTRTGRRTERFSKFAIEDLLEIHATAYGTRDDSWSDGGMRAGVGGVPGSDRLVIVADGIAGCSGFDLWKYIYCWGQSDL